MFFEFYCPTQAPLSVLLFEKEVEEALSRPSQRLVPRNLRGAEAAAAATVATDEWQCNLPPRTTTTYEEVDAPELNIFWQMALDRDNIFKLYLLSGVHGNIVKARRNQSKCKNLLHSMDDVAAAADDGVETVEHNG